MPNKKTPARLNSERTEEAKARVPAQDKKNRRIYSLDELLAGMTPENRHEEIDFGPPVGREVF